MSAETLKALEEAISAHAKEEHGEETVCADWFVGYALISVEDGTTFSTTSYVASDSAAHSVYGAAKFALEEMKSDVFGDDEE